jgi:glycyl-tRNA synthetase
MRASRLTIPFSIGQVGKAFRNEVTPGNFTFRTIEFEQMEFQTFCEPGTDMKFYEYFKEYAKKFFIDMGLPASKLRFHDHDKLAFYAKAACDVEYLFPFGWGELNGTHDRTDYDLSRHQEYSGKSMLYIDQSTGRKYIPYIVESTVGVDRGVLAILCEAYHEDTLANGDTRQYMSLHPFLAPYKATILPLSKKKHSEFARALKDKLVEEFPTDYDDAGSIGKRYRRSDIAGTPFAVTIDDDTINRGVVTVRERDSMKQITIPVDCVASFVKEKIRFDKVSSIDMEMTRF